MRFSSFPDICREIERQRQEKLEGSIHKRIQCHKIALSHPISSTSKHTPALCMYSSATSAYSPLI